MIDLFRRGDRPLVVGHRGAPALAPENTLEAFAAAVALGVDVVELDLLDLDDGQLVVAHSDRLDEVTHGAVGGRVGCRSLAELRELAPALPSFEDAVEWFVATAPDVGVHVDVKLRRRVGAAATLVERTGLAERAVFSSADPAVLHEVARTTSRIALGLTYPHDRLEISRRPALRPAVRAALALGRAALPHRLPAMVHRARAGALMLQHRLVTPAAVARAHALGCPVLAWTVDDPADVARVVGAGVDAVITNDPGSLLATLAA